MAEIDWNARAIEMLFGAPDGVKPQGVIHVGEAGLSGLELNAERLRIAVAAARRELIERCVERAYLWAVLAGTQTARQMALALAREMREMGKEE